MKVRSLQSSFVSGEIAPSLFGRSDLDFYRKGAARLRNVYAMPQGGAKRREGLQLIDFTTGHAKPRMVSFEFNTDQVYLLVFTPAEMKVYKDGVLQATVSSSPVSLLTADILNELNWTQSADTLILAHKDFKTSKITRTSHVSWTAAQITFSNIPNYDYGSGAEAVISATRGWPRSVGFKFSRLWLGGLKARPQTILASKVGSFFDLDEGTAQDDEAINITIDDDRVNAVRNLFPGRNLQIFTSGGEFSIAPGLNEAVTPGNIAQQLKKATLHGSSQCRPVSADGSTIFVDKSGYVVRQFVFNELEQSFNSPNISLLSPHLIRNPVRSDVRGATEGYPANYVYLVNDDGTMAVLNILRDENLLAWTLFETDGAFEDVAVVGDDVYVAVRREIDGDTVRTIEKLNPDYLTDMAIQQTAEDPETDWDGFDDLEGATVKVIGDDFILDDQVVTDGGITASEAVSEIEAGLDMRFEIQLLPVDLIIGGQSTAGRPKRLVCLDMRLEDSRGVVVQQKTGEVYKPVWRHFGAAVLNLPVQLFTGWKRVFLGGFDEDAQVTITQEDPLEAHVLAVNVGVGI